MTIQEIIEKAMHPEEYSQEYLQECAAAMRAGMINNNMIRQALPSHLYTAWDNAVCEQIQPGQMAMAEHIRHTQKSLTTTKNGVIVPVGSAPEKIQQVKDIKERAVDWLIPGYIPRRQITTLAAEGGAGKTTVECAIAAAVSAGKPSFLVDVPFESKPEDVLFLSAEDSFEYVLKRRLVRNGADTGKIYTIPISDDYFSRVKFNTPELAEVLEYVKPGLVIFDPIQNFVPPDINMAYRNAMRQSLNNLIGYGEKFGSTFIIAVHSNKQSGAYGRKRIADSADIWDISRSVLMMGETGEPGLKYLSHEKCNVAPLSQTVLLSFDDGLVIPRGYTDLKDRDYVGTDPAPRPAPARQEAKELILETLEAAGGKMASRELDAQLIAAGVSGKTLKRAKAELKTDRAIQYYVSGFGGDWVTEMI